MKKTLTLLASVIFLLTAKVQGQTACTPHINILAHKGEDKTFTSSSFVDEKRGFILGQIQSGGYVVYETSNGGHNWHPAGSINASFLMRIFFLDKKKGFAMGDSLYRTTDGGKTWSGLPFNVSDISFPTPSIGYTGGALGRMFKTTDGGNTWQELPQATPYYSITAIEFTSATTGYITASRNGVGSAGSFIYKTTDGGQSWTQVFSVSAIASKLQDLTFTSATTGYTSGFYRNNFPFELRGVIYKTTDAGTTWNPVYISDSLGPNYIPSVSFSKSKPENGFAVGDIHALTTQDGGSTWQLAVDSSLFLQSVTAVTPYKAIAGADKGRIVEVTTCAPHSALRDAATTATSAVAPVLAPNPNDGRFSISFATTASYTVKIYNATGSEVSHLQGNGASADIDLSALEHGLYYLMISDGANSYTKTVVKE